MEKQNHTRTLRFPEFDGEWDKKKLGKLADVSAGGTPSTLKEQYWNGTIRWMNSGELNLKRVYEVENRITEQGLKHSSTKLIPKYCVLIGLAGQGKTRGTVAMNMVDLCTNQSIASIYPNDNLYCSDYLYHNLDNRYDELRRLSTGEGGRGGLNLQIIKSLVITFPTIPEQQKIASFFTTIDKKISQFKRKKILLEQYKNAVMQKILSQDIRFRDDDGRAFPKWEKKKLAEVLYEHLEVNDNNKYAEVFSVAKHKGVINQIEHLGRSFSAKDIAHYKIIHPYDIVYTKSPTSEFPFGIIKQNMTGRTGVVSPLYAVFKPQTIALGFLLHNYFLYWKNTFNYLHPLIQKGAKNTMNINNTAFLNGSKINLPVSEVEQSKIADFLTAINDKICNVQSQIEKTELWKKGLVRQMLC
jgi:type I restriction enzyme S subunit